MRSFRKYIVTAILIIVNILVFLVVDFTGGTDNTPHMVDCGAVYGPLILEQGQWFRLFTSMFLHFDISHLMNNMVVLGVLGERLELVMNKAAYLAVYLLSGLGGNVISLYLEQRSGSYSISAGASGAVFGLMGALIYVIARNRGRILDLSMKRVMIMAALSVYLGFADAGVNNAAHLGGMLTGIIAAVILYHPTKKGRYP